MVRIGETDDGLQIEGVASLLRSLQPSVGFDDLDVGNLAFVNANNREAEICGSKGTISGATCETSGLLITREMFRSPTPELAGIRLVVENRSDQSYHLNKIQLIDVVENQDFKASNGYFTDWRILRTARNKNDIPGAFRPSVLDQDFETAALDSSEIPAGLGVSAEDTAAHTDLGRPIVSEPAMYIETPDSDAPGLMVAVLGQEKHLSQLVLTGTAKQDALAAFRVMCEFDHSELGPGSRRETHWLLFWEANDHADAYRRLNDMLADYYNCPVPDRNSPSLYCTWYFYAHKFTEDDLDENLACLRENPIPFDIFLLDDGWSDMFGSWEAGERFPSGMQAAAQKIKAAGYRPGIWTCPFVVMEDAPVVEEHPELLAQDENGNPYVFRYMGPTCYAVDPTSPYAETYFNEMYGRLGKWGFEVHKFDFLRSILTTDKIRFHRRDFTRAQAYRLGMELVRRAIGEENYILACGGLFEATIGLADGMRIGSDTRGVWNRPGYSVTIKQNVMRNISNRFWQTDPDAIMLRLRDKPYQDDTSPFGGLSLGSFNDEEAFTAVCNQYWGGGMTCLSERFAELQPERREMLRHIIPARFPVAKPLNIFSPGCPDLFLSEVEADCPSVGKWWTVSASNWEEETVEHRIAMADLGLPEGRYALFEFKEQRFLGCQSNTGVFKVSVPRHGTRLVRVAPLTCSRPIILGTDLHITGGAVELADVRIDEDSISGSVTTDWPLPIRIWAGFPRGHEMDVKSVHLAAGKGAFEIS